MTVSPSLGRSQYLARPIGIERTFVPAVALSPVDWTAIPREATRWSVLTRVPSR